MPRLTKEIIIKNPQGLHARPAALFVQITTRYNSDVTVQKGREKVNGKSIMGILTLGIEFNSKIMIEVDGVDASDVLTALIGLLTDETTL